MPIVESDRQSDTRQTLSSARLAGFYTDGIQLAKYAKSKPMSLSREDELGIIRNKLVRLGIITDSDTAHNLGVLESRLARTFQQPVDAINPYVHVGRVLRYHRERRLQMPRHVAVERANKILHSIGDPGFCHQSALCQMEGGRQRIYYLQAVALADVYGIPYDAMIPPDYP